VSGVVAEVEGRELVIGARRAVILTCGGFENDPQLKWDFLMPRGMRFQGSPSNTGDGVRMAAEVGSSLWHMGAMASGGGVQVPGFEAAFSVSFMAPGFIYVDRHGHRFFEETYLDLHQYWEVQSEFDTGRFEHPRVPMYAIFDEEVRLRAPLVGSSSGYSGKALGYQWSADNSEEINKGWIMKSTSLLELAEKAGLDGQALEATVARYNEHCAAGNDPDFHRPPKTLKSIQGPPYYAVEIWPVLLNTQGGPRRDEGSRVLDSFGKPIPRLYAAGELGSIWGFHYHTSSNLAECIVYGRIAGRNAAQVEPIG
jgi:succinate dehydrogenase/fumarate reductase flavoprotein subunit